MSLQDIAKQLVATNKGILAADESTGTIKKRFDTIAVESTPENHRWYRQMLFTTPGISDYISGVILFDETIRQNADDGRPLPQVLSAQGIIPGIKVDQGAKAMPDSPQEKLTSGLEGLAPRLEEYYGLGARFAKWRAVITIGEGIPTDKCIEENAKALAGYAKLVQAAQMVPIVEPEVLMNGKHTIEKCYEITKKTLQVTFAELQKQGVDITGTLLKPNMVIYSLAGEKKDPPEKVAAMTVKCFQEVVPHNLPGIVFLSGGQSEEEACKNLNAINKYEGKKPWQLSFSYGRALQASALKAWLGKEENMATAQQVFWQQAKLVSLARQGKYGVSEE